MLPTGRLYPFYQFYLFSVLTGLPFPPLPILRPVRLYRFYRFYHFVARAVSANPYWFYHVTYFTILEHLLVLPTPRPTNVPPWPVLPILLFCQFYHFRAIAVSPDAYWFCHFTNLTILARLLVLPLYQSYLVPAPSGVFRAYGSSICRNSPPPQVIYQYPIKRYI